MWRRLLGLKPVPETDLMFYAVRTGRECGIFKSWKECEEQVKGYPNARFKKFKTRDEALTFIEGHDAPRRAVRRVAAKQAVPCASLIQSSSPSSIPVVYTDGGCCKNGRAGARAGIGVFWGVNDNRNISERLSGNQTNQRAELNAAIRAIETAQRNNISAIELRTDSMYTINCVTNWMNNWKRNGWKTSDKKEVKNQKDLQRLDQLCGKVRVNWVHVRGHQGEFGNEQADRLATEGLEMTLTNS